MGMIRGVIHFPNEGQIRNVGPDKPLWLERNGKFYDINTLKEIKVEKLSWNEMKAKYEIWLELEIKKANPNE